MKTTTAALLLTSICAQAQLISRIDDFNAPGQFLSLSGLGSITDAATQRTLTLHYLGGTGRAEARVANSHLTLMNFGTAQSTLEVGYDTGAWDFGLVGSLRITGDGAPPNWRATFTDGQGRQAMLTGDQNQWRPILDAAPLGLGPDWGDIQTMVIAQDAGVHEAWGINYIELGPIPEPTAAAVVTALGLTAWAFRRRRR